MSSHNTYHLTWVSPTLDAGHLFTAAPAKRSHCSLPWTRGISSWPPLLTLNLEHISLVAQMVKRLPTVRETRVQFLGQEDLLEKEMATHSSILAWNIPWTEELGGYSPWGRKESDTTE